MDVEYDSAENARNIALRGVPFELARRLDWNRTVVVEDIRQTYPEARFQALGPIDGRLHMLVFAIRGETLRVISLRKASARGGTI